MTRYLRGFDSLTAYQMRKLSIFDDEKFVASVTMNGTTPMIFARTSRSWSETNMLVRDRYTRTVNGRYIEVKMDDADFLQHVAERAQGYNFSTELINE